MNAPVPIHVKSSAPGQYLGYALQPVRMCYHLLNGKDGEKVSLEYLDDVAVHFSDGSVLVEQTKSALSHNPLSDWSEDLWKTIANWLHAIQSKKLDISQTQFRLYVTPVQTMGTWSNLLHSSKSQNEVKALKAKIEKRLKDRSSPPKCMKYLEMFLNATETERYELVRRMEVVNKDNDPLDALRSLLSPAIPAKLHDVICEAGIGMAKERADQLIRQGNPAIVEVADFLKQFHSFVQMNNMAGFLPPFFPVPDMEVAQQKLLQRPDFVKQLELIEVSADQQLTAISDFLRTSATKTFWADAGLVFEGSFGDWKTDLKRHYSSIKSQVNDLHSAQTDIVKGRTVYNQCSTVNPTLGGRAVPGYFTHGSFNALADDREIGWHPQYPELLD